MTNTNIATTITQHIKDTRIVEPFGRVVIPNPEAKRMLMDWGGKLTDYGETSSNPSDNLFAYHMFNALIQDDKLTRPRIVNAPPGFGKSTMLKTYLRRQVRTHDGYGRPDGRSETFGAIVVMNTIAEIKEVADYVNAEKGDTDEFKQGDKYAYYIRGYDKEVMSREQYEQQFANQSKYNVVLMTAEQFRIRTVKEELHRFAGFKTRGGQTVSRDQLLIDEKPTMVITETLTVGDITSIMSDIRQVSGTSYEQLYNTLRMLRNNLESPDIENGEDYTPEKFVEVFQIPYGIKAQLYAQYGEENIESIAKVRALESFVNNGGGVSIINGRPMYTSTVKIAYDWTVFNTYILDGTGILDADYIDDVGYGILAPDTQVSMDNVTFHYCDDYLFSKGQLSRGAVNIANVAKECRVIQERHGGQLLVVSNKEYIEALQEHLADADNIRLKHYDGGRATNLYKDIDTAVYFGNLYKGDYVYGGSVKAIWGGKVDSGVTVSRNGVTLDDELAQEYREIDQAVNFIQETNRTRPNRKIAPVNFYVFNKDLGMMEIVYENYNGVKKSNYSSAFKLMNTKSTGIDAVIELLGTMYPGQELKKGNVRDKCGIKVAAFKQIMRQDRLKQAAKRLDIEITRFTFKKRGETI